MLSTQQAAFLAEPDWMQLPWGKTRKTARDLLHDIAAHITVVYAFPCHLLQEGCGAGEALRIQSHCQQLYAELMRWRARWHQIDYPHLRVDVCSGPCDDVDPCDFFVLPSPSPSTDYSFMMAEWLALRLIVTLAERRIAQSVHPISGSGNMRDGRGQLERRLHLLQKTLLQVLCLPWFDQAVSDAPGLTEGRYRSLLPTWALAQCRAALTQERTDWWDSLAWRVNYGIC